MGFYCTVVVVTALLLLSISAKLPVVVVVAKDYRVGGTDGWTFGPDFLQWSEQYNFTVGDALIFNYVKGQHNTYQVTEDAYKAHETQHHHRREREPDPDPDPDPERRKHTAAASTEPAPPPESRGNRGAMLGKWWRGCAALVFGIFTSLY
uniref:Phytocyanin domain-containing protein n=1 Tax=Ananas comosus var. bracteatus TaxID=296719 RepID=A0A6V7PI91_ANACO|nr:unnamed protein product [Ananas comosus var. bracteatus]